MTHNHHLLLRPCSQPSLQFGCSFFQSLWRRRIDTRIAIPSLLHQRHVNRGLIRYARLSGRAEPSPLELLTKMKNRLDSLHTDIRKRYNHEGIEESISHLVSINSIFPGAPIPNQAHVSDEGAGGYSPSLLAVAVMHTVTEAKEPEFPSTMGLDIQ